MSIDPLSFYPRAKVKLIVRFEEFGTKVFTGIVPKKPTKNLKGIKDERAPLEVTADPLAPAGVDRKLLLPKAPSTQGGWSTFEGGPQDQSASDDGLTFVLQGIVPIEAKLSRNGLRIADTLTLKIRFIDCPVDPRTIRSCGVKFYLGTISARDHADNVHGNGDLIADSYVDENGDDRTNLRFTGFIDKWEVNWAEKDEPTISITCRDNTALMIDTDAPVGLVIEAKATILDAVANFLTHFPAFAGISVEYRGLPGETPPKLSDALSKTAFMPELGPPPSKGGGASGGEKLSVWDYLTDTCGSIGHTIRLEGNTVIIQRARTYMSSDQGSSARRPDDPFKGRGDWKNRRWIYGRNVLSMKTSRAFSRTAPTNIEVRAYDCARKKTVVGRFPSTGDTVADAKPGGIGQDEKWRVYSVSGVTDEKTLRIIAQNIYEQVGRNELEVSLKSRNLASFGGGNLDPDVLDMLAGDAFELLVNRDDGSEFSSLTKAEASLVIMERSVAFMKTLGFPEDFATAYAKAFTDAGFQSVFKCKSLELSWSVASSTVDLDIVGVNYVEIRADKLLDGK